MVFPPWCLVPLGAPGTQMDHAAPDFMIMGLVVTLLCVRHPYSACLWVHSWFPCAITMSSLPETKIYPLAQKNTFPIPPLLFRKEASHFHMVSTLGVGLEASQGQIPTAMGSLGTAVLPDHSSLPFEPSRSFADRKRILPNMAFFFKS